MTTKTYQELIEKSIFIGGADDAVDVMKNEKVDVIVDLRAESANISSDSNRIHCPIVDGADLQDESVNKAINSVVKSYNDGKKVFVHCGGGSNRTGTVAIGTLLALGKADTIAEAEKKAKTIRPKINVKPAMKDSLKRLFPDA
ncbi:dual specificity protein phosphatase family protein [Sporosarcina sp. Marseille-Q4063]|uniref:protein-tyrosine phosphatase family protein n=1 Tax=Sporosarcina sp. Marseille-Q4063 TaxID=2810514 RepID=UPI001BAEB4B1|nr:dual specificity protein phosphatase family protein [Sporosarcina sp. Marseille-Q4063]QUW20958.1 dual specificity protein phosphatase family protein [Sporosarcina sp. Marseille-Q4063]